MNEDIQESLSIPQKSSADKDGYSHQKIERKWQRIWEKIGLFWAKDFSKNKKFYCLDMFPYPSGEGLHVGHPRGYVATDVFSHFLRRRGYNLLHPMGWDAFGLPAENYAIKTRVHPRISTRKNIKNFRRQIKSLGIGYDWRREINTTDPKYYRFTQQIFLMLFKKGLAYEAVLPINWCPSCKTGLANEEVVDGKCDRCHAEVGKKDLRQWVLRITAYADRLLKDLDNLDWPEKIKEMQKNWIGRSEGWEIGFEIRNQTGLAQATNVGEPGPNRRSILETSQSELIPRRQKTIVNVFTTRPDTLFGATYLILAPEHPIIEAFKNEIRNYPVVKKYIEEAKNKTERERISEIKNKTGVEIRGIKAINPANLKEIPIWVADYVLMYYGTGAIMGVPAHDRRDFDFAKTYNLSIIEVIKPLGSGKELPEMVSLVVSGGRTEAPYGGEGVLINSGRFNGMKSGAGRDRIGEWLTRKNLARKAVHYKLRDWVFSRQRYWGEPIPIIHCPKCGLVPLSEKDLPLKLPQVEEYQPTGTGESPLAAIERWVRIRCPKCGGSAERETNTMPQWAGSCWYYIAYAMVARSKEESGERGPRANKEKFIWDKKRIDYWLPVDLYVGGAEHAVLHLLYARFWHKVLFDMNLVSTKEPFLKLKNQGLVLAPDGQKMSKSRGNVINPDDIVRDYGADTLRLYEMFMGPFGQEIFWSTQGIRGCRRFLERVWHLKLKIGPETNSPQIKALLNKTIKKVGDDIGNFRFNTAVSALMTVTNEMAKQEKISLTDYKTFLKLLAPFAPHLTEEIWQGLRQRKGVKEFKTKESIHRTPWPSYEGKPGKEEEMIIVIQINGKVRDKLEIKSDTPEEEIKELSLRREKVRKWVEGKEIKKIIFVPQKLINIVFN